MSTGLKRKRCPKYSEETLTKAIEDVKSGVAINVVSRKYKIPRTTLHSRVTKKHSSRLGTKPALDDRDEADLARWIEHMCAIGCSVSRNQIGDSVVLSLKTANKPNPFVNTMPGKNWFDGFLRRRCLFEKLRMNRRVMLDGVGEDGMKKWFADLNDELEKEGLNQLSRERVYSIGDISLPLHEKTNKWCIKEGPTVIFTGNAAGLMVPPMIVFNSNDDSEKFDGKLARGWTVEYSEDADMSAEILYNYVKINFYKWLIKNNVQLPVVLFMYQQLASYLTHVLCDFCEEKNIMLKILPPSPHRATTPIEISFFPALRKEYRVKFNKFIKKSRLTTISKNDFVTRLEEVLYSLNVEDNWENGFYKCGFYPLSSERYIRACIKLIPEDIVQNKKQSDESSVIHQSSVLKCIESGLNKETLRSFRLAVDDVTWTGKIEDTNLFYLWRKLAKNVSQQSDEISESNDTEDDSLDHEFSDSENENQENERPTNFTSTTKLSMPGDKQKPLILTDNNLNNECFDRNASIIVVRLDACIEDSDLD